MSSKFIKIHIPHGDESAIGSGKADLLEAIIKTGSISAAGRLMGMSYRRAWDLVDTMNRCFSQPIVTTVTGGSSGGGAMVTEFGMEVLRRYRDIELRINQNFAGELQQISGMLAPLPTL